MQLIGLAAAAYLAAAGLWSANDPFVGKWKLDLARSVIVDQMAVEAAGPNTFRFRFEGSPAETIVADGTDQPGLPGTTLSVKPEGARTLEVVRKQGGHVIVHAIWRLSEDGRTLRDTFDAQQSDGPPVTVEYVYRRMSDSSGFAGAWESTTRPAGLVIELEIQPHGDRGLSFTSQGVVTNVRLDGRPHPVGGGAEVEASGLRHGERALEYTKTSGGKVLGDRALTLSHDGKTLTMRVRVTGQVTPGVLVFERE